MISEGFRLDRIDALTTLSDRQASSNSVDPDHTLHSAASDQGSTLFATQPTILHTLTVIIA